MNISAAIAEIRLMDSADIEGSQIALGAIAVIDTEDADLKQRLLDFEIGESPKIGQSRLISSYKVRSLLKKEKIEDVKVLGGQSTVHTLSKKLSKDAIQDLIEDWLKNRLGSKTEVDISYKRIPDDWDVPVAKDLTYTIHTGGSELGRVVNFTVRAVVDNKVFARMHLQAELTLHRYTAVIVRPVQQGETMDAQHIEVRRADVTKSNGMELTNIEDVIGMEAKKDLPIGTLIYASDFVHPVVVERGTLNRIMIVNGTIRMMVTGARALQSGRKDELIMFSNPLNSGEPIHARVLRTGLAKVELN